MSVRTASIAERDIVQAALWLEQKEIGLGARFLASVDETFNVIEQMPLACPTLTMEGVALKSVARWISLRGFPHLVFFIVDGSDILVIGVLHPHQDLETILSDRLGTG
jgi:hypothetical protein